MNRNLFFPTTIVDGFFEHPDEVREFALEQEYRADPFNSWPGKRSRPIHELNRILFDGTIKKISNLFYGYDDHIDIECISCFQLVDKKYFHGWVHRDDPAIFTAIIYLTPDSIQGTSLFRKNNVFTDSTFLDQDKKDAYSVETDNLDSLEKTNALYEETINVKGIYNRLFVFDSLMYHGAHSFFGDDKDSSRLTLVMFFNKFSANGQAFPIQRMNMGFHPTML